MRYKTCGVIHSQPQPLLQPPKINSPQLSLAVTYSPTALSPDASHNMAKTFLKQLFRRAKEPRIKLPADHPAVVLPDPTTGTIRTYEELTVEPKPGLFTVLSLHHHQVLVRYVHRLPLPPSEMEDDNSEYAYVRPMPKTFEVQPGKKFTLIVGNTTHFIVEIASILEFPPPESPFVGEAVSRSEVPMSSVSYRHEERRFEMRHASDSRSSRRRTPRRSHPQQISRLDLPRSPLLPTISHPASASSPGSLSNAELTESVHAGPSTTVHTTRYEDDPWTPVTPITVTPGYLPTPQSSEPSRNARISVFSTPPTWSVVEPTSTPSSPRPRNADLEPVPPVPQTPPTTWAKVEHATSSSGAGDARVTPVRIPRLSTNLATKDLPPIPNNDWEAEKRASKNSPGYNNSITETSVTPTPPHRRPRGDASPLPLKWQAPHTKTIAVPSTRTPIDESLQIPAAKAKREVRFLPPTGPEATFPAKQRGKADSPAPFLPPGLENVRNPKNVPTPRQPPTLRKLTPVSLPNSAVPYPVSAPRPLSPLKLHQPRAKRLAVELLGSKAAGVLPKRYSTGRNKSITPYEVEIAPIPGNALGLHNVSKSGQQPRRGAVWPQLPEYLRAYSGGKRQLSTSRSRITTISTGIKGMSVMGAELREEVRKEESTYWEMDPRTGYPAPHATGYPEAAAHTTGPTRRDYGYGAPDVHGYAPRRQDSGTAASVKTLPPNVAIMSGNSILIEITKTDAISFWTNGLQPKITSLMTDAY